MSSSSCTSNFSRHCRHLHLIRKRRIELLRKWPLVLPSTSTSTSTSTSSIQNSDGFVRQYSSHPAPRHTRGAAVLVDNWETTSTLAENKIQQFERIEERQKEFLQAIADYRDFWYEKEKDDNDNDDDDDDNDNDDDDDDDDDPLLDWKQATQFQHPALSKGSWEALMQSEDEFANICILCHKLFVATASLTNLDHLKSHTPSDWDPNEFLTTILPFWELLRDERTKMVELYRPTKTTATTTTTTTTDVEALEAAPPTREKPKEEGINWMGWLQSMLGGQEEEDTTKKTARPPQVTAHQDPEIAPSHYHYTKLVGRLYFHYPQSDQDWLQQRASQIQRVVEQSPGAPVLTDKIVRLLVRSFQDIGTLEASYQAEQLYHQYPNHQKGLLWYVLMGYLKVTQSSIEVVPGSPKAAALATKRVCELLAEQSKNSNEFHSLEKFGFQCLANISSASLDDYYERVHALCLLKFGNKTWEALLNNTLEDSDTLRPKDSKTLQLLIQIFGQDEKYLERAKQLLETTWTLYAQADLQDSVKRSTFHSILSTLHRRKGAHQDDSDDFDFALKLLDKMMMAKPWWPNEDTWIYLFRLANGGPQTDLVWTKYELCRGITQQYSLTPLKAAKYALNAWSLSSERGHPDAAERALDIFHVLQVQSTPLLFKQNLAKVAHVYSPENAPDHVIYTLVLKTCARVQTPRSLDITLQLYEYANRQQIAFTGSMYSGFLRCVGDDKNEKRRLSLAQELYDSARAEGRTGKSFLKQLRRVHPELYERHIVENPPEDDSDEEEDIDEDDVGVGGENDSR